MNHWDTLWTWTPYLLGGLAWNVAIAAVAMAAGTLLGALLAYLRLSPRRWNVRLASGLTTLSRNAPTIVFQFYLVMMMPTEWGVPAWLKAALALALAVVGFTSDNLMIALRQWRQGERSQALLFMPAWGTYLLIIVIASSTASIIGVGELVSRTSTVINATANTSIMIPLYLYAMVLFFVLCWPLIATLERTRTWLAGRIRLARHNESLRAHDPPSP